MGEGGGGEGVGRHTMFGFLQKMGRLFERALIAFELGPVEIQPEKMFPQDRFLFGQVDSRMQIFFSVFRVARLAMGLAQFCISRNDAEAIRFRRIGSTPITEPSPIPSRKIMAIVS